MSDAFRLDPDLPCDTCGCFGAFPFDTESLCVDCHAGRGSCCSAEFSGSAPRAGRRDTGGPAAPDGYVAAGTRANED